MCVKRGIVVHVGLRPFRRVTNGVCESEKGEDEG